MYCVYRNQVAAAYSSLYSFFSLSNFQTLKFSSSFSQELWGLEDWNLIHTWTVGRCIVCTWIRLLLLIHSFIFSFFFLSNFQMLKRFVTLFSGTVRLGRLKLGTHVDNGQMYCVYRNQAAAAYSSLYSFFFLSNFQTLKVFVTFFSGTARSRRLKLGSHADSGQIYSVYWSHTAAAYSLCFRHPFIFFILSNFQTLKCFITLFSGTWGLEGWHLVYMWTVDRCIVYTRIRLLLLIHRFISLFFFLSKFQTLKCYITLFSETVNTHGQFVDYHVFRN